MHASATPIVMMTNPGAWGRSATPCAASFNAAVTSAPPTSTAVTSTAWARASAANQHATYAHRSTPVSRAHPHAFALRPVST